ncbi:MogA/MoaB family molybdenum cofactor biosynthesis protein [Demequina sp. SO4-18]|uniref:MogA/MoaB family molybdenum cofactor biosynthesis protein n=1 Tax=Demequina sp. SO4-18 TaxID=3401026 RepID=UPI003B5C035B
MTGASAAVITVSDRRSAGEAEDTAGPAVADALHAAGAAVEAWVVPDGRDSVTTAIEQALSSGARIVLTAGGTGVHPRDVTPEATRPFLARELPGIPELLRATGSRTTATAALSRGLAGVSAGHAPAVIVNLPGSEPGAREGIETLLPVLAHLLSQIDGGDH